MGALIWHLKLQESDEYFKNLKVGKSVFKRYSNKALDSIKQSLEDVDMSEVWQDYLRR